MLPFLLKGQLDPYVCSLEMAGQRKLNPSQWLATKWQSDSHFFSFPRITEVMSDTDVLHDDVAQKVSVLAVILETPSRKSRKLLSVLQVLGQRTLTHPHSLWVWQGAAPRLSTEYIMFQWIQQNYTLPLLAPEFRRTSVAVHLQHHITLDELSFMWSANICFFHWPVVNGRKTDKCRQSQVWGQE